MAAGRGCCHPVCVPHHSVPVKCPGFPGDHLFSRHLCSAASAVPFPFGGRIYQTLSLSAAETQMDTREPIKGTPDGTRDSCPPPAHVAGGSTEATAPSPPPYLSSGNTLYYIPASPQGPVYYSGYNAGYPPGQNVVVSTQPGVIVAPVPSYQRDYLGYSIFTMLCCCLPIGLAALIFSIKTRDANRRGEAGLARSNSSTARILNHVALGIGLLVTISWMGYAIFVIVTLSGYYSTIVNSSFDSNHYYG